MTLRSIIAGLIVCLCASNPVVHKRKVYLQDSDVYLETAEGVKLRLTADARAKSAALSPDMNLLAVLKSTPDERQELSVYEVSDNTLGRQMLAIQVVKTTKYILPVKSNVEWSRTGKYLFFLCDFSNLNYLVRYNAESGDIQELVPLYSYSVVRSGKYEGNLIAHMRKFTLVGPWDWYWLLDEDGREIGAIGGEDNLSEFVNRFCRPDQRKPYDQ